MKKKKIIAMIPARMESSRFPGKPLAMILDLPMIEHVRRRVALSEIVDDVYVATCNREIFETVERFGGKAVMTANTHERCTDRIVEAIQKVEGNIVCIVQGDEPLLNPEMLDLLTSPVLKDDKILCANLLTRIHREEDLTDVDVVKAVLDRKNFVLYYSRSPIPFRRIKTDVPFYRQTGLSVFAAPFLKLYSRLTPTPLEVVESVDFMRMLEHRYPVLGVISDEETVGVDRADDVEKVEDILRRDPRQNNLYKKILMP